MVNFGAYLWITVIHKSGDPRQPQNYRPITVIPLLYKLFARLLYNRLEPTLDAQQPPEQAGFRKKHCTNDHLFALAILQETAYEWQVPVWTATLDFKKAFDTVSHHALWQALAQQGVQHGYIHLLTKLYTNQVGVIKTDVLSREFQIQRGTKQGDPLSSLLFNALLEDIMRTIKPDWIRKKMGLQLGHTDMTHLTNLRFAGDVILVSSTLPRLQKNVFRHCSCGPISGTGATP